MILNLNFSRCVNVGVFDIESNDCIYSHQFFILEDSKTESKYYMIDVVRNKSFENGNGSNSEDIVLEKIYILDISFRKDIVEQIIYFLKDNDYVIDVEDSRNRISKDINISYFEVRYNFYENSRMKSGLEVDGLNILCCFSKVRARNIDGSLGAIVEDLSLYRIKKMLLE